MNYKKIILDNETEKIKNDLKGFGAQVQTKAVEPKERLMSELSEMYDQTETNKSKKFLMTLSRPFVWIPAMSVSLVLICAMIIIPQLINTSPDYYGGPVYMNDAQKTFSPNLIMDEGIGSAAGIQSEQSTFKDVFIRNLGQHEASPEDVAKYGSLLAKDININILLTKETANVETFATMLYESAGGYVENIGQDSYNSSKYFSVRGKIPADKIELFRAGLKNLVGSDKYYQENLNAQSRTADIVVIDQKIKDVENAIKSLQTKIANATDETQKSAWQKQLNQNRAYLAEREQTKKQIMADVNYIDVSLYARTIPSFWHAQNFSDIKQYFNGFETVSMWNQMSLNALFVFLAALKIFSWTFWAIAIVIWLIVRKRKKNKWLEQME